MGRVVVLLLCALASSLHAGKPTCGSELPPDAAAYEQVDYKAVKLLLAKHQNKKITYGGRFLGLTVAFLPYIEESGLKATKYLGANVCDLGLPVMIKRTPEMAEFVGPLKVGTRVQVYGKLRKFRRKPLIGNLPRYYLELHHISIAGDAVDDLPGNADPPRKGGALKPEKPHGPFKP